MVAQGDGRLDELERTGGRYALITMCAAGGMAPAIVIERVDGFAEVREPVGDLKAA